MRCLNCNKHFENEVGICPFCGSERFDKLEDDWQPNYDETVVYNDPKSSDDYSMKPNQIYSKNYPNDYYHSKNYSSKYSFYNKNLLGKNYQSRNNYSDSNNHDDIPVNSKNIIQRLIKKKSFLVLTASALSLIIVFLIIFNTALKPNQDKSENIDLSVEINRATSLAQTFSTPFSNDFSFIDSSNILRSFHISDSEVSYSHSNTEFTNLLMVQCSVIGPSVGVKNDGSVQVLEEKESFDYPEFASDVEKWSGIKQIAVYYKHIIGLKENGTLVTAGTYDNTGYDTDPLNVNDWNDIKSITTGTVTVGLKYDGTLVSTDERFSFSEIHDIAALPQGSFPDYNIFLQKNGTLTPVRIKGWQEADEWDNIVQFCTSEGHLVGLKKDGTVVAVGSNDHGECNVSNWTNIVAIQASSGCTIGKRADGTFVIASNDEKLKYNFDEVVNKNQTLYQTTTEPTTIEITTVEQTTVVPTVDPNLDLTSEIDAASKEEKTFSIGEDFFAYIDKNGQAHQFEINGSNVKEIPYDISENYGLVAMEYSPYANGAGFGIKNDGSVILLSNSSSGRYDFTEAINHMSNVKDIVGLEMESTKENGESFNYAWIFCLHNDGTVIDYVFKEGEKIGYLPSYSSWNNIKSITVDFVVPIGLMSDGTIVKDEDGKPTQLRNYKNIAAVPQGYMSSQFGVYLKKNGTVECNNDLDPDEISPISFWTDIISIADSDNTIGLKKDGTVVAEGSNDQGQCNVSNWKNIVAIQTNKNFTVGKRTDGTFVLATNDTTLAKNFDKTVNGK